MNSEINGSSQKLSRQNVVAGVIGNSLEWYDFGIYAMLAPIIGAAFFPSETSYLSTLYAFGGLAVGYLSRPVGAMLFGHIGDKIGRKPCLLISVSVMGIATVCIGLLPTTAQIGTSAAVILILLRMAQGISVGGEYTGSATLLAEQTSPQRRGLAVSWISMGACLGYLLGTGLCAALSAFLGEEAMHAWGWRIPFLFGVVISVVGIILRRYLPESPELQDKAHRESSPVLIVFRTQWPLILRYTGVALPMAIGYFLMYVYAAAYLTERMHFTTAQALEISTINMFLVTILTPVAGWCCDRFGRKPMFYLVAGGTFVAAWPLWWMMHHSTLLPVLLGQMGFAFFSALSFVVVILIVIETAPLNTRCSTSAIGYNFAMAVFGGTTPMVATFLVERTHNDYSPVYYLMLACVISLIAVARFPETAGKSLHQ